MAGQLFVSVSGIRGETLEDVERFRYALVERGVPISLLVTPRRKDGYRLESDVATAAWLKARREQGSAIMLHGCNGSRGRGGPANLPAHEANLRLVGADRVLEHLGLRTRVFAAPRWTVSEGTLKALPRNGFRLMVGWQGVTDLVTGTTTRDRLLGIGAGFLTEPWWCKAVLLSTERMVRRGGTVRLATSGKQIAKRDSRKVMLEAVDIALTNGCTPAVYEWSCGAKSSKAA